MSRTECWEWSRFALMLASRAYRAFLLTLAAVALAPMLLGWSSYTVRSGSMEPSIMVGDVVIGQPVTAHQAPVTGRVMVFTNPARTDGDLLVHRVVQHHKDGTFTTRGDNNLYPDSTPVSRADFRARAVLLAPYAGLPIVWWADHDVALLALWGAVTVAAFLLATSPRRPPGGRRRRSMPRRRRPVLLSQLGLLTVITTALLVLGSTASATYTSHTVNGANQWTVGAGWHQPYLSAALTDKPWALYLLDESQGDWATDSSGNAHTGQYTSVAKFRQAGALPNNFGYSVALGTSGRVVAAGNAITAPTSFSLEAWFKTTTTSGGPIASFANTRDSTSSLGDRQLEMTSSGKLTYGAWGLLGQRTISSPKSYNDGQWHHVVLTTSGNGISQTSVIYVDGAAVASGSTTATSAYSGWWRFGEATNTWLVIPIATGFDGTLDDVAVYTSVLSAARVAAHYNAR